MKPILSPIQLLQGEARRNETLLKVTRDLLEVHSKFISKLEEVSNLINKKIGPKGDKGDTPTEQDLLKIIKPFLQQTLSDEALLGLIRPLIPQVKDGNTPSKEDLLALIKPLIPKIKSPVKGIDYPNESQIKEMIASSIAKSEEQEMRDAESLLGNLGKLPKGKGLTTKHIDGLEQTLHALRTQTQQGYLHGGGDTVLAGSNITIVESNGKKIISSTGGGTGYTKATPTGAVNGSNTSYTVTNEPVYVIVDGATYFDGAGYTYSALSITMDNAPTQYIRYFY